MAVVESELGRFSLFLANPMVAKINKVKETGEPSCEVASIARKTLFFLLLTGVGIAIFFITSSMVPASYIQAEGYNINEAEAIITCVTLLFGILGTWISFKFIKSAFFFGSIYSLGQGYAVAFLCNIFGLEYTFPCLIALGFTILIVLVMFFLYRFHIIRVEKKFLSVLLILICVGILLSLAVFILSRIPETKEYANYILQNGVLIASLV